MAKKGDAKTPKNPDLTAIKNLNYIEVIIRMSSDLNFIFLTRTVEPKVFELRTGLRALPLQPYVNGRGKGCPAARNWP